MNNRHVKNQVTVIDSVIIATINLICLSDNTVHYADIYINAGKTAGAEPAGESGAKGAGAGAGGARGTGKRGS